MITVRALTEFAFMMRILSSVKKAQNKGSSALRVPVSAADRIGIAVGRRGVRAEACARAKHQRLIGLP